MQTAKFEDIPIKTEGVEALEVKKITIFIKAAGNPYCSVKLYVHDFELVYLWNYLVDFDKTSIGNQNYQIVCFQICNYQKMLF